MMCNCFQDCTFLVKREAVTYRHSLNMVRYESYFNLFVYLILQPGLKKKSIKSFQKAAKWKYSMS